MKDDIRNIMKSIDPNKAHGHDLMNIGMLKTYGNYIYKTLPVIFRASLDQSTFPLCWKKTQCCA